MASLKYRPSRKSALALPEKRNCSTLAQSHRRKTMKVNDRVTVKTDGGPRRPGVVLAVEEFSEGTMYLVSLEDNPLGIWFFNEAGHQDGIFVEKAE
ncbi:TPA: protein DsrB [Escherichia coli]|nr:protein DsrB [Escherichia coli]HBA8436424.1 protein DsrB [Escherichia coli]HBA9822395.1 protein DsrB [Escherichia coli]HBB0140823.1 protein DsrB [Escherichia coli]